MLEDLEEDTHLCIKCSLTIVGLENYVRHRKNGCSKPTASSSPLNREIIDTNHSYQPFEFTEPSVKHFNYGIETVSEHHHDDATVSNADHIISSPQHQTEKASDYKLNPQKSLTESYDYNYGLGADVFFSLLNLQSSSKLKQNVASTSRPDSTKSNSGKLQKRVETTTLAHSEHMDDWISTSSAGCTDNLMKAVNAISGTKKLCFESSTSLYNYEYPHERDSPEPQPYDDDDDDDEEDEEIADEEGDDSLYETFSGANYLTRRDDSFIQRSRLYCTTAHAYWWKMEAIGKRTQLIAYSIGPMVRAMGYR